MTNEEYIDSLCVAWHCLNLRRISNLPKKSGKTVAQVATQWYNAYWDNVRRCREVGLKNRKVVVGLISGGCSN